MIFTQALSILLTILLPGLVFIVALKRGWFAALRHPIDRGIELLGKPVFGPTKTWLGVLMYTLGGAGVAALLAVPMAAGWTGDNGFIAPMFATPPAGRAALAGASIGLSYSAAELVNSFVKRRIGIPPSAEVSGGWSSVQRFFDLADGILAVVILFLFWRVDPLLIAVTAVLGLGVHALTDVLMQRLRLKRRSSS